MTDKISEAYIQYCKTQTEFHDRSDVFEAGYKAALSSLERVAICDTKNRIRFDGNDDRHRFASAPSDMEVGTELYATTRSAIA